MRGYVIIPGMKKLEEDIRNGIYKHIYLLHGDQSYLRLRYVKALTRHFAADDDTMNVSSFYGKKIDLEEVASLARTLPFFSEKRVIVLEETGLFSRACGELTDLIKTLPEETVLICSEDAIDDKSEQVKAVATSGCIADFSMPPAEDLRKWVLGKLGREHRPITRDALDMFLSRCGDDMWQISNDLEKLISYTFGKDGIREEDVEAVCAPLAEDKIFNMIDAMLDGNTKKALDLYTDLVIIGKDPLHLIREQLRLMLHLKQMGTSSSDFKAAAKILGMKDGRVKMALSAARKRSKIYFTEGITKCADLEEQIKTSKIDAAAGVESLIIELCRRT